MLDIPEGGFGAILVDCPWRYRNYSDKANGAARAHYPGMTYRQLRAIPVGDMASEDAVILQWGTWPKLDQAVDLLREWGFDFVSGIPWVKTTADGLKPRRAIGHWSMGCSEFALIGRRGKPKTTPVKPNVLGLLCGSKRAFWGPRPRGGGHSNKPYVLHEWIEDRLPGPYLELFARERREGWTCWGNELGQHICAEGVLPLAVAERRGLVDLDDASDSEHGRSISAADRALEDF